VINVQKEIETFQKYYSAKLQEIQLSQQWHLLPALNEELQKKIIRITGELTQTSGLSHPREDQGAKIISQILPEDQHMEIMEKIKG
jgi:hypothetical protein